MSESGSEANEARASAWVASGLIDLDFYSALRGRDFPDEAAAARDLVARGMEERLSPHPFLDFATLPAPIRKAWREGRAKSVLRRLEEAGDTLERSPLTQHPEPERVRQHLLSVARELATSAPIKESASPDDDFVALQAEHLDWDQVTRDLPNRVPGRTSIVIPTYADCRMTVRAVSAVLEHIDGDVEVIVVDNGSPPHVALSLAAQCFEHRSVRLMRLPRNLNYAAGSNIGFAHSTGDVVVFLNNDTEVHPGWLQPLRSALNDQEVAGAQSLLLYPDGTIQTAGTVFVEGFVLPCHFLVGLPADAAGPVTGERFSAITGAAMALRAADVVEHHGFDPAYRNGFEDVDLCLRLRGRRPGDFRVVPDSVVTHHESRTAGRFQHAVANRQMFATRHSDLAHQDTWATLRRYGYGPDLVSADELQIPAPRLDSPRPSEDQPHRPRT